MTWMAATYLHLHMFNIHTHADHLIILWRRIQNPENGTAVGDHNEQQ